MPSRIRLDSHPAQFTEARKSPTITGMPGTHLPNISQPSPNRPSLVQSVAQVPTVDTET